jgi:hypothetical protein
VRQADRTIIRSDPALCKAPKVGRGKSRRRCRRPQGDRGPRRLGASGRWRCASHARLLGRDPTLVLHGGGNTPLKTEMTDLVGETHAVLCPGSGRDMATIDPAGLPAVARPLRQLRREGARRRGHAAHAAPICSIRPAPSRRWRCCPTFVPHAFADSHANAVLSLIDQPSGEELARRVYGARLGSCHHQPGSASPGAAGCSTRTRASGADPRQAASSHPVPAHARPTSA